MTAQTVAQPAQPKWPGKNLDDVAAVLLGDVDEEIAAEFHAALKAAWATAKAGDTLQPMLDLVEAWWPQAVFWTEPGRARQTLADVADIQKNGLPPERRGRTREQVIAAWEQRHGQKLNV